ncbi:RNA-binding protein 42 [Pezoporus flaviventris]|uniref:RNA-binding protein 42 n=2 Tax=Pezoporus TaxID=35539 RepID=UPI002AAF7C11|nr:RNA-binding protein 42 [Pezoporus flaviventris]
MAAAAASAAVAAPAAGPGPGPGAAASAVSGNGAGGSGAAAAAAAGAGPAKSGEERLKEMEAEMALFEQEVLGAPTPAAPPSSGDPASAMAVPPVTPVLRPIIATNTYQQVQQSLEARAAAAATGPPIGAPPVPFVGPAVSPQRPPVLRPAFVPHVLQRSGAPRSLSLRPPPGAIVGTPLGAPPAPPLLMAPPLQRPPPAPLPPLGTPLRGPAPVGSAPPVTPLTPLVAGPRPPPPTPSPSPSTAPPPPSSSSSSSLGVPVAAPPPKLTPTVIQAAPTVYPPARKSQEEPLPPPTRALPPPPMADIGPCLPSGHAHPVAAPTVEPRPAHPAPRPPRRTRPPETPFLTPDVGAEPSPEDKKKGRGERLKRCIRTAAGSSWEDPSLLEWDADDFRIFCGDLGNEVNDDILARAFGRYPSFLKAKVIRDKRTGKTKGYGFVSFKDPNDYVRAMREMNGKYVGSRPIKLRKSMWKDRNLEVVRRKQREKKKLGLR